MSNRWLRFGIALLAIGAAAAAGYRIFQQDGRLVAGYASTRTVDQAAQSAVVTISELKAALHAYVAEGQGDAFWFARAATLMERLRASILELEGPATAAGSPLTEALDLVDRIGAAEQRARAHVRDGQRLMAGDVIFTDTRDMLDALRLQVLATRTAVLDASVTEQSTIRREQAILALGAAGILAFATLLLVIPGATTAEATAPVSVTGSVAPVVDDFDSSARVVSRPATPPSGGGGTSKTSSGVRHAAGGPGAAAPSGAAHAPASRSAPVAASARTPPVSLTEAAAVCTELGRVSQSIEITALLGRAATVLNATGAIVWMATADRHEIYPAAAAGYDERLLARIGSIKRDAANVTAAALRDASPRTSPRVGTSAAALAVPLMTPLGPVGVFSAEIRDVFAVDDARLAVATIFAAQLATLLGSMAVAESPSAGSGAIKAQA
jgi:hypothetical protein